MLPHADAPLRPWSFPLRVLPDELLSSWLSRSAHLHGIGPYAFLNLRLPTAPIWSRDIDLTASASVLSRIDRVADTPAGTAEAASLVPFTSILASDRVGGRAALGGHVPFLLCAGIYHRKRRLHALQFCPLCLAGPDPFFRRSGRLAFVVACPVHGTPLRDGCPRCDAPVVPHRAPIGRLGRCHACDADLTVSGSRSPSAIPADAVPLQVRCLAALTTGAALAAGLPCSGIDYLALVRTLVAVVVAGRRRDEDGDADSATGDDPLRRRQIERMRVGERASVLAEVARWIDDWPRRFEGFASDFGLTQRSFLRLALPPVLAAEVARLPEGVRRRRAAWRSMLDDAVMRRLRREDEAAYRNARASRLLATVPVAMTV